MLKFVFAHFIVGITLYYSDEDWSNDIKEAKRVGIDGFALNIASADSHTQSSLDKAFAIADSIGGFGLFLSFDYLATGPWSSNAVIDTINKYKNRSSYFHYLDKPFASTFEGVDNTDDWGPIKERTGCFFVPSWTSLGPVNAASKPQIDGLFSWDAWPNGPEIKNENSDQAYQEALGGRPYMMPVSPWFYTNLPQWNKNWLWKGDTLWNDRWFQVFRQNPMFVQILTWNDFGESHYIGPIRKQGIPPGAQWYVENNPHDGWRTMLPYYIQMYKFGNAHVEEEKIAMWYKPNPSTSGDSGGTTCNVASHGQQIFEPGVCATDQVFVTALVHEDVDVWVQIGANTTPTKFQAKAGIQTFSCPIDGHTGAVSAWIARGTQVGANVHGPSIESSGRINWNAMAYGS